MYLQLEDGTQLALRAVAGIIQASTNGTDWADLEAAGGGGGSVVSVVAGTGISVDATDPTTPIVALASPAVIDRAQTLLGVANITKQLGSDFDNDQWYRNAGTGGTITPSTTKGGGVVTLSTSSTSGRTAYLMPHGTIVLIGNKVTEYWYAAARFAITSTIDAAAVCDFRMTATTPASPQTLIGVIGSISTSFFSYLVINDAGATTVSGATTVPIDTSMHVWEMWGDTTNMRIAIDGTTVLTTAVANIGANPVAPMIGVNNGATSADQTIDVDYLWVCTGDPS
jgi:hypothetical protein